MVSRIIKSTPVVCICVPTYNSALTLECTIRSIQAQNFTEWILHVVDNASTDSTIEIAKSIAALDERILIHEYGQNIGGEGNFTRCLGLMSGQYGAIFHADDMYRPDMLASAVADFELNPRLGAVFCESRDIDEGGRPQGLRIAPIPGRVSGDLSILDFPKVIECVSHFGNFFICPSAVVRSSIYRDEIKNWDGGRFGTSADLDVWLRIAVRHDVGVRHLPLMNYRVSSSSYSYQLARIRTSEHDIFKVFNYWVCAFEALGGTLNNRRNVLLLREKDFINRSINLLIKRQVRNAWCLWCAGLFNKNFLTAFFDKWHRYYRLVGIAMFPFLLLWWIPGALKLLGVIRFKGK